MGLFRSDSSGNGGGGTAASRLAAVAPVMREVGGDANGSATAVAAAAAAEPRVAEAASQSERKAYLAQMRSTLHQKLVERLNVQSMRNLPMDVVRQEVRVLLRDLYHTEKGLLTCAEQEKLLEEVLDETFGLGPLEALLKDPAVTDILVNRFDRVYVERGGRLELSDVRFRDNAHLRHIIDRIVVRIGRRVDDTSPMVDARLADGSRVNAIIPPLALDGCAMSIRRFGTAPLTAQDLVRNGAMPPAVLEFLAAAVQARCNVLISGGTGSGKTTLLNCLSRYIPPQERVITIEDAAELQLQQPHVVRLETRPANIEGSGEVTQRELVRNSLRMRPDRVIIGECRAGETLDMLQAMNTGHEGSMTTIHANSPRDALSRIEVTVAMAGFDIPIRALRHQIASALHLIVQVQRLKGGRRKVVTVSELTGVEGEQVQMHDVFVFEQTGVDASGHAVGQFVSTGIRPKVCERFTYYGLDVSREIFERQVLGVEVGGGGGGGGGRVA